MFADEIYDEKSDRQTLWRAFLKKGDIQNSPETLSTTAKEIEHFLIEPIMALNDNVTFDKTWKQPKGWDGKHLVSKQKSHFPCIDLGQRIEEAKGIKSAL